MKRFTLYRLQGSVRPHLDNRIAKKRFMKGQLQAGSESGRFGKKGIGDRRKAKEEERFNWSQDRATKKSSYKEHRVDALAPYAEEGRGKLRKATGSRKQALIRRHPNGETRQVKNLSP